MANVFRVVGVTTIAGTRVNAQANEVDVDELKKLSTD